MKNALSRKDKNGLRSLQPIDRKLRARICHSYLQGLEDSAHIDDKGLTPEGKPPEWDGTRLQKAIDGRRTEKTTPFYKKGEQMVYRGVERIEAARETGERYNLACVVVLQVKPREVQVIDVEAK